MKYITVKIPLDESVSSIGVLDDTMEFIDQNTVHDEHYQLKRGVLQSLHDRIFKAIKTQSTTEEIKNI